MGVLTVAEVEEMIGRSAESWRGKCYSVSCAIVKTGLVNGRAVYGHYHGPVVPTSIFAGRPFVPHGWILLENGKVMDPTRWVFLDTEPEIWVGDGGDYDWGGNRLRHHHLRQLPEPCGEEVELDFKDDAVAHHFSELLQIAVGDLVTAGEVAWVANLPVDILEPYAREIYEAITAAGQSALIPIDNREMILG